MIRGIVYQDIQQLQIFMYRTTQPQNNRNRNLKKEKEKKDKFTITIGDFQHTLQKQEIQACKIIKGSNKTSNKHQPMNLSITLYPTNGDCALFSVTHLQKLSMEKATKEINITQTTFSTIICCNKNSMIKRMPLYL